MARRVITAMTAALLAAGLNLAPARAVNTTAVAQPACATTASCTYHLFNTNPLLTVHNGVNNADLAMIDYDIYQPLDAGGNALSPQPAVMYFNGFGGSKTDSSGVAMGKYLSSHGYVVLTFSSEGFGNSKSKIELDSPEFDVKNAEALITEVLAVKDYVAKKPNGDPIVGTTGGSYGGAIQILLAEFDTRIDAITPFRTWNSLEYSLVPNNLQTTPAFQPQTLPCCGVAKFEWTSLFFASGLTQPLSGHGDGVTGTFLDPNNAQCPGYDNRLCPIYVTAAVEGSGAPSKALLDDSSPATYFTPGTHSRDVKQISHGLTAPTLLGQGEADTLFNVNDSVANYEAIKARGVPVKMIWHSNGHGYDDQPGEGDVFGNDQTDPGSKYLPQRILAWFDRYLRLDTSADTGPEFAYYRDWVPYSAGGSAEPAYGTAPSFPAEGSMTFTLSGTSDLAGPGSAAAFGEDVLTSPPKGLPAAYTETSNFQCPTCTLPTGTPSPFKDLQPTNIPGQFAAFTSQPFQRDVVSVGIPSAHVHVTHSVKTALIPENVILFGSVWDVDPAGNATMIKRLISPIRITDFFHSVDMNLVGFAHLFPKGHRVRFQLAATDMTSTSDHLVPDFIHLTQNSAAASPTSMLDTLISPFVTKADAWIEPSTFTLPVDSAGGPVINPTNGGVESATTGTPNTGVDGPYSPVPGISLVAVGVASAILVRRRRRRAAPGGPGLA